jgi:hypothetical protein
VILSLVLTVLVQAGAQAGAPAPAEPKRPPIVIQSASSDPVSVHYLNIPWGPNTFAAMEKPGDSFYNKRPWPFARLETARAVTLEETRIPAGNYALVFHPNTPDDTGMTLEVRRIAVPEFLQAGNVMTAAPEGESVWKGPVRFAVTAETAPSLAIDLLRAASGVSLTVRYGDRRLVVALRD